MGNFIKKAIASALCVSFLSLQTAAIANQMTGVVLKPGIGSTEGADIVSYQGGFTGFKNPEYPLIGADKNNATLNFNGDAVINWGHLNVGGNQSLTFANGNNVVLNNVLKGMSTFAGNISGDQGQIIISNPNGMIMQGGRFETSGALTLTTKDLTGIKLQDGKFVNLDKQIDEAGYKNDYAAIVFKNGTAITAFRNSAIEAGDINIIAKGIDIKNAELVAKNGNVVLKTTDGANFVAETANGKLAEHDCNVEFKNNNTIQIATSSIKTKNGGLQLITDKGNVSIASPINSVKIVKSDIKGDLNVDTKIDVPDNWDDVWALVTGNSDVLGDITVTDSKVSGTMKLATMGNIIVDKCSQIGNLITHSELKEVIVNNSHILGNADLKVTGKDFAIIPYYNFKTGEWIKSIHVDPTGGVVALNTAIDGIISLDVTNNAEFVSPNNLHFVNPEVKGILKADAANKLTYEERGKNTDLNVNSKLFDKYQISAGNELSFKSDKNVKADNETFTSKLTSFFGKNVELNNIETTGAVKAEAKQNVTANNIKVNTGSVWENILGKQNTVAEFKGQNVNSNNSSYNGEVIVNADTAKFNQNDGKILKIMDSAIGELTVDSNGEVYLGAWNKTNNNGTPVQVGSLNINTTDKITVWDTNVTGESLLTASNDINIYDSGFNGATINGKNVSSSKTNYAGSVIVNADNNIAFTASNVGSEFNATAKNNVSIIDMIAGKINANGKNVTLAKTNGDLTVDKNVNLTAEDKVTVSSKNGSLAVDGSTINAKNVVADAKANNDVKNVKVEGTIKVSGDRIAINDCESDKLAIINPDNAKFTHAEIFGTKANTTEFANGEYLYIDLTESTLFGNNRDAIIASANNVDKIVIYPTIPTTPEVVPPTTPTTPGSGNGSGIGNGNEMSQESVKTMNNLRSKGIDTVVGQNFSPIAFAAYDKANKSGIYKAAGDKIFKDLEKVVHITERFDID